MNTMQKNETPNCHVIDFELDKKYGPVGSEKRKEAINKAQAQYIADVLADMRKSSNITQAKLAELTGVDKTYISKMEHAQVVPSMVMFRRLADALGYSIMIEKKSQPKTKSRI